MEVHAHSHTPRKKWIHYLWEFIMLFLAVFCGFLAENQREHYMEKKRVKEYAGSLIEDLQKDTAMISIEIFQIKSKLQSIDSFAGFINGKKIHQINNLDLLLKSFIGGYRPLSWNRATIQQIINSGSLRYFANKKIVAKISAYDAFTKHLDEDFKADEARLEIYDEKRGYLVDLNYPFEIIPEYYNPGIVKIINTKYDSIITTSRYREMSLLNKPLIAKDINEIKTLVNLSLLQKIPLKTRGESELPILINNGIELIQLLKKEYHFE